MYTEQSTMLNGLSAEKHAEYVRMDNVIEFKPKDTVYILKFTAPPLKMTKAGGENIPEINKVDDPSWFRTGPALNLT